MCVVLFIAYLIAIANALHTTPDALLCDCLPANLPEDDETSDSLSPLSKTEEQFLHEWYVLTKELLNSYEIRSKELQNISKEVIMNNPYIPDVSFELIPISKLVTELNYQRNLSKKHIKEMIASFDIHQVNVVKVKWNLCHQHIGKNI